MSIPALGGGANQALQRLLRETAERALTDEQALLEGEDPTAASALAGRNAASTGRTATRRRGAGPSAEAPAQTPDEAIVVKLGDAEKAERLEVAGGWITAKRGGPLETKAAPETKRFDGPDIKGDAEEPVAAAEGRTTTAAAPQQSASPAGEAPRTAVEDGLTGLEPERAEGGSEQPVEPDRAAETKPAPAAPARPRNDQAATLDRLIVVLKKTGISFRDAYQVLREINAGGPLPPKSQLQARWALADPEAWEARARTEQARSSQAQPVPAKGEAPPVRGEQAAPRADDADLRRTAVDDVIRDRAWRRDNPEPEPERGTSNGLSVRDDARPTLQSVVRYDATNQAYIAALNTAEFQRLVTILGGNAPEWFWGLRGHRGLRGLAERPAVAKLNTTRIAGTRLGAWILAILGMALIWYLGVATGTWW